MLYLGNYSRDNMNTMQMKADDYLNNLNIENIVDSIDITKAVKIEVNLGE